MRLFRKVSLLISHDIIIAQVKCTIQYDFSASPMLFYAIDETYPVSMPSLHIPVRKSYNPNNGIALVAVDRVAVM